MVWRGTARARCGYGTNGLMGVAVVECERRAKMREI
jgi:hypothetical protein